MSAQTRLAPADETLGRDEQVIRSASFRRSNIAVWSRVELTLTNKRLAWIIPNLFLGLVRTGTEKVAYPLPNVAGVAIRTRNSVFGLILGGLLVVVGVIAIPAPNGLVGGLLSLILGILFIAASFRCEISVTNSGGQSIPTRIAYLDRTAASAFVREVGDVLAASQSRPAPDAFRPPQPARARTNEDALTELARLNAAGLITPAEYESKKREILARL
jgi:hypothetical protein